MRVAPWMLLILLVAGSAIAAAEPVEMRVPSPARLGPSAAALGAVTVHHHAATQLVVTFTAGRLSEDYGQMDRLGWDATLALFPEHRHEMRVSAGSVVRVESTAVAHLEAPRGQFLLGPNPLAGSSGDPPDPWSMVRALPTSGFILVPEEDVRVSGDLTIHVEHGIVTIDGTSLRAGRWTEPPPAIDTQQAPVPVRRVVTLTAQNATLELVQGSVGGALDHWRGTGSGQGETPPAPGHWHADQVSTLPDALAGMGLAATVVGIDEPALIVTSLQAGDVDIPPSHDPFRVEAASPSPDGRSMLLRIATADAPQPAHAIGSVIVLSLVAILVTARGALTYPAFRWAWALYARIEPNDLERHPLRRQILDGLRACRVASGSELHRLLECNLGTLYYHLAILERGGLVRSFRGGRERLFHKQGPMSPIEKKQAAILRSRAARRFLEGVEASPGLGPQDLRRRLGLSPSTIHWHATRLADAGLIHQRVSGASVEYHPIPSAQRRKDEGP